MLHKLTEKAALALLLFNFTITVSMYLSSLEFGFEYIGIVAIRHTQSARWMTCTVHLRQCTLELLTWDGWRDMREGRSKNIKHNILHLSA